MTKTCLPAILLSSTIFLSGCFGLFDNGTDRITGKYIVQWIDLPQNQTISEELEMNSGSSYQVVPEYVFAVGHNEDYIIAKQHPSRGFDGGCVVNTKITNYYIIDMNKKWIKNGDNVWGPLKQKQFDSLRTVLKIENLVFDQKYPDNP